MTRLGSGNISPLTMTNRPLPFLFHTCFMWTWMSSFIGRVLWLRTTYVFFYCRSRWVVLSCLGGPFICHSVIRNWQDEVLVIQRRLGEGGQLRLPSDDKRSFFCPAPRA